MKQSRTSAGDMMQEGDAAHDDTTWCRSDPAATLAHLGETLSSPKRQQVLSLFLRVDEASTKDMASVTELTYQAVTYHVRYLVEKGYLRLKREERARGAVRNVYEMPEGLRALLREIFQLFEKHTRPARSQET